MRFAFNSYPPQSPTRWNGKAENNIVHSPFLNNYLSFKLILLGAHLSHTGIVYYSVVAPPPSPPPTLSPTTATPTSSPTPKPTTTEPTTSPTVKRLVSRVQSLR